MILDGMRATNRAMLHAHLKGALHGAALMMGQPGTAEAVAMARDHPTLRVGLHWHFNDSQPLTRPAWPWGNSPAAAGWAIGLRRAHRDLALAEAKAQLEAFLAAGLTASFFNSHHHLQIHPRLWRPLWKLAERLPGAWLRLGWPYFFDRGPHTAVAAAGAWVLGVRPRHEWARPGHRRVVGPGPKFRHAARTKCGARWHWRAGLPGVSSFIPRTCDDQDTRCLIELGRTPLTS